MHRITLIWLLLLALVCCSPSIKPKIDVSGMSIPSSRPAISGYDGALVFVDDFRDSRSSDILIQGEEDASRTDTDVTAIASEGLSQALRGLGFVVADSSPVIISGTLREWRANVKSGLPSKVTTKAAFTLEAFDPANKLIYKGSYEGFSSIEHPSLDEEDIRESLASAMGEAIEQVTQDRRFLNVLTSF